MIPAIMTETRDAEVHHLIGGVYGNNRVVWRDDDWVEVLFDFCKRSNLGSLRASR
jgi:hypothetical protein